ncbi:MAG TPA: alkaline phosphatase family protein [Candidatus Acidoferrales bacterium]|nr:alkaline phosphatase family protein [Candidatus Acidoferrales bacterium]
MKPAGVFVLIDALGWPIIEEADFLSHLLTHRQPVRTVLGFSSGAIPTILTGAYPAETGHWNLFYYDPEGSPFRWLRRARCLPDAVLDHRITRKLLTEAGRRALGLGDQFECQVSPRILPYFNFVEKRSIYQPGGIAGARSIFDCLAERRVAYRVYTYHRGRDAELVERAVADLRRGAARFYFLYLSELDAFLHAHWGDQPALRREMTGYATGLERLFGAALAANHETQLAVFSDHGMTPVRHHIDLAREIEDLGFRMPEDLLAVYDSTMARFWFFRPAAREAVSNRLKGLSCGRPISDNELRDLGVYFPDRRFGELIFLLEPGWLLATSDFHRSGWMPAGMHGYHPSDRRSDGVFLSNRQPAWPIEGLADVYRALRAAAEG